MSKRYNIFMTPTFVSAFVYFFIILCILLSLVCYYSFLLRYLFPDKFSF